jgi:hypothetical protein
MVWAGCLIDLAVAQWRAWDDPAPPLERARDVLISWGEVMYLEQVKWAESRAPAGVST